MPYVLTLATVVKLQRNDNLQIKNTNPQSLQFGVRIKPWVKG